MSWPVWNMSIDKWGQGSKINRCDLDDFFFFFFWWIIELTSKWWFLWCLRKCGHWWGMKCTLITGLFVSPPQSLVLGGWSFFFFLPLVAFLSWILHTLFSIYIYIKEIYIFLSSQTGRSVGGKRCWDVIRLIKAATIILV